MIVGVSIHDTLTLCYHYCLALTIFFLLSITLRIESIGFIDLFVVNTDNIVETRKNVTYHPSRLMGINDIHNADSLVDLISGLGIPKEKLIISFPSNAYQFQLVNKTQNLPQSLALGAPKLLTQQQLCKIIKNGNWTIERDEDLTAPYTFKNDTWIAFDDEISTSIKSKYIALSNLAGAAIMNIEDQDWSKKCSDKGPFILNSIYETFTVVTRKPRQTQLLELQELLHEHSMDAPTRVARVVDHEGAVHVVRRDVKINFECSRQGYFVHPTGCNRFYRCVKFNQYTDDFTVFEYDCPAGLAFDERWEVCVWPGSLPDGGACQGSSEIAPVPRNRFQCPQQPGYYADPENCRWFFACLDHVGDGVTPLTAYEFRCPFSLVFNEQTLVCDWPWNVQGCGKQGVGGARFTYGDLLEGRLKPSYATVPDYLVSGGRIESANAGNILGTYYGANGVLDINGAADYASESQQSYGAKSLYQGPKGVGVAGSSGQYSGTGVSGGSQYSGAGIKGSGQYSGEGVAGSGQYSGVGVAGNGQYSGEGVAGSGQYSGVGVAGNGQYSGAGVRGGYSSGSSQYGNYAGSNEGGYANGLYPGDSGDDGSYHEGKYGGGAYTGVNGGYTADKGAYSASSGAYNAGSGSYSAGSGAYNDGSGAYKASSGSYSAGGGAYKAGSGSYSVGSGAYNAGSGSYSAGSTTKYSGAAGSYVGSNEGSYVHGKYPGDNGNDGSYHDGKYRADAGSYNSGSDAYKAGSGSYSAGNGAYGAGSTSYNSGSGSYSAGNGAHVRGQYDAGKYKGEQYSGSDQSGTYVSAGESSGTYSASGESSSSGSKEPGKYYGAASDYNKKSQYSGSASSSEDLSGTKYSGESGQYDAGKYSSGQYETGKYSSEQFDTNGNYLSSSGNYGAKISSGQYYGAANPGAYKGVSEGSLVSSTISPFLSTSAGQYTLSNGLQYSGPTIQPSSYGTKLVTGKVNAYTPSTLASTTVTPKYESSYFGGVSSTTPVYSTIGTTGKYTPGESLYSGVSLSGEKFGVNGESGHISSPVGHQIYSNGFDQLALQVNSLQPSLSENVDQNRYSTSGNVFFSSTTTPGGFSSYSPGLYSTPAPTTYYSSTSLPASFSPIVPQSYVSTTPAPIAYSSYSTPSPIPSISYSTQKPVSSKSYSSKSSTAYTAPSIDLRFGPPSPSSYESKPVSYNLGQQSYKNSTAAPVVASYPTPAPPAVASYSRPASPAYVSYSTPTPHAFGSYSTPPPPAFASYSTPAPPAIASYSRPAPPAFASYSTPAPPAFASYSTPAYASYSTPAPPAYASYSTPAPPAYASYSTPAPPAYASYSTPAPPAFASYSTPAQTTVSSYSAPTPSSAGSVSYGSYKPSSYSAGKNSYKSSVASPVVAPAAIASYSTPAQPTYASYSTPIPPAIASYSRPAQPVFASYSTPAPPAFASYSTPEPPAFGSYSTPAPPAFASYSTPAPPAIASYSRPAQPVFASYSTPAPPAFASYSTPEPPAFGSYSTPAPPAIASYSRPAQPVFASYSTPAPPAIASYSKPAQPAFASYSTPVPPSYVSYSTLAPAVISYSTPAQKTYYQTSTPAPIVKYSTVAPQIYKSSAQFGSYSPASNVPVTNFESYPQSYSSYKGNQYSSSGGYLVGEPEYSGPAVIQQNQYFGAKVQGNQYSGAKIQQSGSYVGQSGAYAGPSGTHGGKSGSYVGQSGSYNGQSGSYSGQSGSYTGLNSASYTSGNGNSLYKTSDSSRKDQYRAQSPSSYEKASYASSTSAPVAYSSTAASSSTYDSSTPKSISYGSNQNSYQYSHESQAYSGDEYLPPVESVSAYAVKKPCDHSKQSVTPQTYVDTEYQSVNYQVPYQPSPTYSSENLLVNPIIVQPFPEVSSFKDYFYSSVLPSYSTPALIAYSSTPSYISSIKPIQYSTPAYSTPIKSYVSSSPAISEYNYVSSYSTPKPVSYSPSVVSTTSAPIVDYSFGSTYTPKPISYSTPFASTTSAPIVDYSFGSTYTPKPISYSTTPAPPSIDYSFSSTYSPKPIVSSTAKPVTYSSTFESSRIYPSTTPAPISYTSTEASLNGPLSYSSYSSPPVVYGPGNLQPIKTYQSTGTYDIQSYTATPKPCASANALDISNESETSHLPDGTYVVGIKQKDKVVIVSRLSDFNPLLVEKLGATCDCHSQSQPIKVVRRRKIKSTTEKYDSDNSGNYNSNSIQSYNAYEIENTKTNPNVDIISYNTQQDAEQSQRFNENKSQKKLYSSRKTPKDTTTEKSDETSNHNEHSNDKDNLSITEFGTIECKRAGLFRHPKHCNKFYQCNWDQWKKKYSLHEFKCPIHLAYDNNIGACNWPSKGPACSNDNLLV